MRMMVYTTGICLCTFPFIGRKIFTTLFRSYQIAIATACPDVIKSHEVPCRETLPEVVFSPNTK